MVSEDDALRVKVAEAEDRAMRLRLNLKDVMLERDEALALIDRIVSAGARMRDAMLDLATELDREGKRYTATRIRNGLREAVAEATR